MQLAAGLDAHGLLDMNQSNYIELVQWTAELAYSNKRGKLKLQSSWKRAASADIRLISGWMRIRGNRRRRGYDRDFVLSDHADWPDLIQTVADMKAQRVITLHGNGEALAGFLNEHNIVAQWWNLRTPRTGP
ncbi:MAG: hypothetical protein ACXIUM_05950 [Wenzhouxiangella sp.]